jgi:hypothetical protein
MPILTQTLPASLVSVVITNAHFTSKMHNSHNDPFVRYAHLKRICQQHFGHREAAIDDPQPGPSLTYQIDVFIASES